MSRGTEDTSNALARTYRVAKLVAVSAVSIVGLVISAAALNMQLNNAWSNFEVPLYIVILGALALLIVLGTPLIFVIVSLHESINATSFYQSMAINLKATITKLEDLAYTDAITGLPNSHALKKELQSTADSGPRCLILIDLRDFRTINKRYNHWAGDEYLRKFSHMVVWASRRNEFVFKDRPFEGDKKIGMLGSEDGDAAKAFRKNQGSDEFFILLEGSMLDGLGYLNRLMGRKDEFEKMSKDVLGGIHEFGFYAGVTNVAINEPFDSAVRRVSDCLSLARDEHYPRWVYWWPELPPINKGSMEENVLNKTKEVFWKGKI